MSMEEMLRQYVRAYEEVMLIDKSANLFYTHARNDQLTLVQLHLVLPWVPEVAITKMFHVFDEDGNGAIDAQEFHKLVRYLNFGSGYCDGCNTPVLEHQHSYYCTSCSDYLLCLQCNGQRAVVHNPSHQFRLTCDKESEYTPGLGHFLRSEIDQLFAEMDVDRSGEVSHGEFRMYCRGQGIDNALIDHFLKFDLNHDGQLSKNELLCILVAMRITRFCEECGHSEFPGTPQMLSCIECTADYDVCRSCFDSGRCSHEHNHYETVDMLQLRRLGLCIDVNDNDRQLVVAQPDKWAIYRPFFDLPVQPRLPQYRNTYGNPSPGYSFEHGSHLSNGMKVIGDNLVTGVKEGVKEAIQEEFGLDNVLDVAGNLLSWLF